jgi:NADH:ubiquinone oxidoreductase subunit H
MYIGDLAYVFLFNCIVILLITVIIMILIIVERKVLSFLQRRVGPNVLDYRGRLQFAVVMLERFSDKGFFMPNEADNL